MQTRRVAVVLALVVPLAAAACGKPSTPKNGKPPAGSWSWQPDAPPASSSAAAPDVPGLASSPGFPEDFTTQAQQVGVFAHNNRCHPLAVAAVEKHVFLGCADGMIVRYAKDPGGEAKIVRPTTERIGTMVAARGRLFFGSMNLTPDPKQGTLSSIADDGGPTLLHEGRFVGPRKIAAAERGVVVEDTGMLVLVPYSGGAPSTFARAGSRRSLWAAAKDSAVWLEASDVPTDPAVWMLKRTVLPHGATTSLAAAACVPRQLASDGDAAYLDCGASIHRVPFDGKSATVVTDVGSGNVQHLTVRGDHVYWVAAERSNQWALMRAPKAGGGRRRVAIVGEADNMPWMSLDVDDAHAWATRSGGQLIRVPLEPPRKAP